MQKANHVDLKHLGRAEVSNRATGTQQVPQEPLKVKMLQNSSGFQSCQGFTHLKIIKMKIYF